MPTDVPIQSSSLEIEFQIFKANRRPTKFILEFWKCADQFPILKHMSRIILSVPASSAGIERLFSQCGVVLTKLRRRISPDKLKALVFTRYAKKYRELYNDVVDDESSHVNPMRIPDLAALSDSE